MLDKVVYKELFSKAFDITIEVTYWNGKKEKYINGEIYGEKNQIIVANKSAMIRYKMRSK